MNGKIFLVGLFYSFYETAYFGWNWAPKCDAEIIADGISLLIFALAFVCSK